MNLVDSRGGKEVLEILAVGAPGGIRTRKSVEGRWTAHTTDPTRIQSGGVYQFRYGGIDGVEAVGIEPNGCRMESPCPANLPPPTPN